jgi:polyhydroxyalkanoate synthesis regulator phasin
MPTTHTKGQSKTQEKDLMTRLASAGEDAVQRLGEFPGGKTMLEAANTLRARLDDLTTRIRAIDPLEKRVSALEKRLTALEKKTKAPAETKPPAKG